MNFQKRSIGSKKRKYLKLVILFLILSSLLIFTIGLSACGTSPSNVVKAALDMNEGRDEFIAGMFGVEIPDEFMKQLHAFEYSLGEETITDDTASIDVTIRTYDFSSAYKAARETYLKEYFSRVDTDLSDDELNQEIFDAFFAAAANADFSYAETVPVPLSKVNGKWVLDDISEESPIIDALTGGLLTALSPSPTDIVKMVLDVFTNINAERFFDGMLAGSGVEIPDDFIKQLQNLEYTLGTETIIGDKATVDVTIKTYDFGAVFAESTEIYVKSLISRANDGGANMNLGSDEIARGIFDAFFAAAVNADFSYMKTVTVPLSNTNREWIMDDDILGNDIFGDGNISLADALSGGFVESMKDVASKLQNPAYFDSLTK